MVVHYLHLLGNHSQAMLRLFTFAVLILNSSAKLLFSNTFEEQNGVHSREDELVSIQVEFVNTGDPLWVLNLSDDNWMAPKLRLGNADELEEFFHYIQPSIKNLRRRQPRLKKDDPERKSAIDYPVHRSISETKEDFFRMINKFVLTSSIAPDAYITDNTNLHDNSPSIALHFKGQYSVLIVELGMKQWHYIVSSRSALPEWFYEEHDTNDSPIPVPDDVKIQIFSSLWRLLHTLFGFPV